MDGNTLPFEENTILKKYVNLHFFKHLITNPNTTENKLNYYI